MEREDGGGQKNGQLCSRPVKIVEPKEGRMISLHVSLPFLDNDEHLAFLFSLFFLVYFYVTPSPVPLFPSPLFLLFRGKPSQSFCLKSLIQARLSRAEWYLGSCLGLVRYIFMTLYTCLIPWTRPSSNLVCIPLHIIMGYGSIPWNQIYIYFPQKNTIWD